MKNLANCKPSEFLQQTNRIRKSVSKWLTDTDVLKIRQRTPDVPNDVDENSEEYKTALNEQAKKNLNEMMDSVMEKYPDETLEILALLCFVEPKDVDEHTVTEYLESFNELINNQAVIDFFTSLIRLTN